jgi:hypothetical protein
VTVGRLSLLSLADAAIFLLSCPVRAPEIVFDRGIWYISDPADFSGIRIFRLAWKRQ